MANDVKTGQVTWREHILSSGTLFLIAILTSIASSLLDGSELFDTISIIALIAAIVAFLREIRERIRKRKEKKKTAHGE